ncbi:MAG: hypothetical protein PVH68_10440 [Armatimonadota bacterium]
MEEPTQHGGPRAFAFSTDGEKVAAATGVVTVTDAAGKRSIGGQVLVWDARTGELKAALADDRTAATWVSFARNGTVIASVGGEGPVLNLWDVQTGTLTRSASLGGETVSSGRTALGRLHLSPDAALLVSLARRPSDRFWSAVVAWDTHSGEEAWSVQRPEVNDVALSPDGEAVAWGLVAPSDEPASDEQLARIEVLDAQTGKVERQLTLPGCRVVRLAFLQLGEALANVGRDTVTVWDMQTGEISRQATCEDGRIGFGGFAFSPDGQTLAKANTSYVTMVDLGTGSTKAELTVESDDDEWFDYVFSPDLTRLACKRKHEPVIVDLSGLLR